MSVAAPQAHASSRTFCSSKYPGIAAVDDAPRRVRGGRQAGARRRAGRPDDEAVHVSRSSNAVRRARRARARTARATTCSDIGTREQPAAGDGVPAARLPAALPLQPRRHREEPRARPCAPSASRNSSVPTILRMGAQSGHAVARPALGRRGRRAASSRRELADRAAAAFRREIVDHLHVRRPELGIDVPAEMRDWYPDGTRRRFAGVATYGRFRRFQVRTDEVK